MTLQCNIISHRLMVIIIGYIHKMIPVVTKLSFGACVAQCILFSNFYHLRSRIRKMAAVTIFMKTKPCRMLLLEDLSGWLIYVLSFFHFWWCCWNITRDLVNNTMVADALPACVARSSAVMVLTIHNKRVFVFFEEGFGQPVASHC